MKDNKVFKKIVLLIIISEIIGACNIQKPKEQDNWALTSFEKVDSVNPILEAIPKSEFLCPVRNSKVKWEGKDVFNPAVVVKDNKVYMLYRAEDFIGKWKGTSRLGLAISDDGLNFNRLLEPVFYPENDKMKEFEWEGGCEDPRIVEDEKGIYYLTYTAWDGSVARLFIATSTDLLTWTKYGSVFEKAYNGKYSRVWSKAGSIVCKREGDKMIVTKINGKYWMYFGESNIFLAHSDDLINWIPIERDPSSSFSTEELIGHSTEVPDLLPALMTRKGKFDSHLIEPGPPAILTDKGILLIYNSKNSGEFGDPSFAPKTYAAGQVLFDENDPLKIIDRLESTFFRPDKPYEIDGQINHVCFLEGLVHFKGKWFLYYGTADSKIAVAVKEN
ncbi:MAG: glycosidase [Bacteroidales bacterium]|nr:glycosidase [Bacteroidales bacterium]